jgi:hypothetical protein
MLMDEDILPQPLQDYIATHVEADESRDTSLWLVRLLGDTLKEFELPAGSETIREIYRGRPVPESMRAYGLAGKIVCLLFDIVKTESYRADAKVMRLSWQHFETDMLARNRFKVLVDKVVGEYGPAATQVQVWVRRNLILQLVRDEDEAPQYVSAGRG